MQCARLGRRNRKGSVFLAFSDVEASSLSPCLLYVHRSFSFGRHPSSVSVTLHRHFVVSRRFLPRSCSCRVALQLDYHLQQLYSPVEARTSLLRRNEKEQRIHLSQLVLAFSHAVPPSTLGPRMRPEDVSGNFSLLEIERCDHRLQSPCQCRLKSRLRPLAPWVSDLALRDEELELAGALSSSSRCESGLPKRTSMTSPSTTIGSSSSGSPSSVMSAKCRVRPSRTASVRFGSDDVTVSIPFGCDCTCASSSACAPILSRFVQASVLYSGRTRQVHTILRLHPSVCV